MIDILAVACLLFSFLCLFNVLKGLFTEKIGGYWWPIFPSDIADKKEDSFYYWIMFARWIIGFVGLFICGIALLIFF
jgi:hypothetical protein